jgi:hypothetical protein
MNEASDQHALEGLVYVADDQHINLEILKTHLSSLGVHNQTHYFING